MVTSIKIYGSSELKVYSDPSQSQYSAIIKDETGQTVISAKPIWSVEPIGKGVKVDSNGLVKLTPPITADNIMLIARIGDVSGTKVASIVGAVVPPTPEPPTPEPSTPTPEPPLVVVKQLPYNDVVLSNPFMGIMPEARKGLCYVNTCSSSGNLHLAHVVNDTTIGRKITVLNADYTHRGIIEIVSIIRDFNYMVKLISGSMPQKGSYLVTWTNPVKLVYALYTWRELEPVKGIFDFVAIEKLKHLPYWRSQGVHCMLKIASDYPVRNVKHTDLPDWLMAEIENKGTYYDVEQWGHAQGFFPDYTNPVLIAAHDRLFKALGDRYNDDDFIYLVEMGSLGYWGEFHGGPLFPKIPIAEQYMTHYKKYFPSKFISCRRNFSTFTKNNSIGYYNDGVKPGGEQVYDWGLTWANKGYTEGNGEKHPADPDIINRGPVDGEPIVWNDTQDLFWSDAQYPQLAKDMDALNMSSFHVTPDMLERRLGATLKNWQDFIKRLGYRYYIKDISYDFDSSINTLSVKGNVENKGWSKFWFKWPIEISIVKGDTTICAGITNDDVRSWASFAGQVKIDEAGTYKLCIAILNPKTGKPSVDFANYGRRADGRYELAEFTLKETITTKEIVTYITTKVLTLE